MTRNEAIIHDYNQGMTIEQLLVKYRLGRMHMQAILNIQGHADEPELDDAPHLDMIPGHVLAALHRAGIYTLDDIHSKTDDELLAVRGIGRKALAAIRKCT